MENLTKDQVPIHQNDLPYIPDNTIIKILSHINQKNYFYFSEVCKRWKYLISSGQLWKRLKFVDFDFINNSNENIFVKDKLKYVEHGDFTDSIMEFEFLVAIFQSGTNIKTLVLNNCRFDDNSKNPPDLKGEFSNTIAVLDLRKMKVDYGFIFYLMEKSSWASLEFLGLEADDISFFFDQCLFKKFVINTPNLKVLECANMDIINDESILWIAENLKNLEFLSVRKCHEITGSTINVLIRECKKLKSLILQYTNINDMEMCFVDWANSEIDELDLGGCEKLTHDGLFYILSNLKKLKYLCLDTCGKGRAFSNHVAEGCINQKLFTNISILSMKFVNNLTFDAFEKLCAPIEDQIGRFSNLKELSLRSCRFINVQDFTRSILESMPNLTYLDIGNLFNNVVPFAGELRFSDIRNLNMANLESDNLLQLELYPLEKYDNLTRTDLLRSGGLINFLYNLSNACKYIEKLAIYNKYSISTFEKIIDDSICFQIGESGAIYRSISHFLRKCKYLVHFQIPHIDKQIGRIINYTYEKCKDETNHDLKIVLENVVLISISNPERSLNAKVKQNFKNV